MSSQKTENLPKNCEHIVQGVAKLSAFRLPSKNFRGSEGNVVPLGSGQLRISVNASSKGPFANATSNGKLLSAIAGNRPVSGSSNSLLRVASPGGVVGPGGRRLLSLDSSAHLAAAVHNEDEWLRTQRKLVAEAAELRRQRDQVLCCASVGASYAFLALSVALSLSVVIAVCLFLHSFVPKEYYQQLRNASAPHQANSFMDKQLQQRSVPSDSVGNTESSFLVTNPIERQQKILYL